MPDAPGNRNRPACARTPALLAALLAVFGCAPDMEPVDVTDPRALARTIARAAEARDYPTLSAHMAEKFSYSFGQEPSREGGIESFRAEPERLDTLVEVLRRDCVDKDLGPDRWFICPAAAAREDQAYYGWRADFRQRADGTWEFVWFIAGD